MSVKYIGLDVHQATTVAAVRDAQGKLVMECILETKASTLLEFLHGLRGELHVTLEEGSWAAWLHDVLQPHVQRLVICDPRKNALLQQGNQNDKIDARKLAELLRVGILSPVYHGENGLRTLRELARSYLTLTRDMIRVMNRIKAVYRGRGIACAGQKVYSVHHRSEWLGQLLEPGLRRRAELLYQQLDQLQPLRLQACREMLQESRRHPANHWLKEIPYIGSIRAALLIALLQTPHRFRTKRQLWAYAGLAVVVQSSADYRFVKGEIQRTRKTSTVRGLNDNRNPQLKYVFKSIALGASVRPGPWHDFYETLLLRGMKPALARLTLARKIAAITLTIWKKGEHFDSKKLNLWIGYEMGLFPPAIRDNRSKIRFAMLRALLGGICCLSICGLAVGQQTTKTHPVDNTVCRLRHVFGTIVDPTGTPIPNAKVQVSRDGVEVGNMNTDHNGTFSFKRLKKGEYELVVRASGFSPVRYHVAVVKGSVKSEPLRIKLRLAPLPGPVEVEPSKH